MFAGALPFLGGLAASYGKDILGSVGKWAKDALGDIAKGTLEPLAAVAKDWGLNAVKTVADNVGDFFGGKKSFSGAISNVGKNLNSSFGTAFDTSKDLVRSNLNAQLIDKQDQLINRIKGANIDNIKDSITSYLRKRGPIQILSGDEPIGAVRKLNNGRNELEADDDEED